jgi:epoxyqueuosine reductase
MGDAGRLSTDALSADVKRRARELGFDPVGVAALGPVTSYDVFEQWLSRGYAGDMQYLHRGAEKRRDTRLPFPGAKSAVVVGLNYGGKQPAGPIARYARGDDYHDVMVDRLRELHRWLDAHVGHAVPGKAYVDTAPILERDLATRAGLGWIGKNTMLINPARGSFFFLGALFLDLELAPDAPFEADRCGTCTRCLEACPTGAFVAPRELDARRCISYLTIEHRGEIAADLHPLIGDLLYGCDICQDVCPWNHRFATEAGDAALAPRPENVAPDVEPLVSMTDAHFATRFRKSPIKRAKRSGIERNATIVLSNRKRTNREPGSAEN